LATASVNPHLGQPVEAAGAVLGAAPVVAVVVHGRGQDPAYMRENLVEPLERPSLTYLLPTADGGTWYPASFLAPLAENEPRLGHALDRLESLRGELAGAGVDGSAVVWVGFSQGACLVTEYVARSSQRFGGLVALTGGLIGPAGAVLSHPREVGGLPAFFGTSDVDPFVPLGRVQETAAAFTAAGADVTTAVYPGATHEIVPEEVEWCGRILDRVESRARRR
jgi:phospholipase/carboxylesterase